jgi:hypothetical protein
METTISYIIIFGFGILLAALYLFRKDKKRMLPVSEQTYSQLVIAIYIKKEKGKITEIILQLSPLRNTLQVSDFYLELTNEDHDKKTVDIKPLMKLPPETIELKPPGDYRFSILSQNFETFLSNQTGPYDRFRFVVVTQENNKFKSHTLAMNARWGLFKQDSGRYN